MRRYLDDYICLWDINGVITHLRINSRDGVKITYDGGFETNKQDCKITNKYTLERKTVLTSGLFLNWYKIRALSAWLRDAKPR